MTTLNDLINDYGAIAFVLADAGNGSAFGKKGVLIEYDEQVQDEYGSVQMHKLDHLHTSEDGFECCFASDWIEKGDGSNPYRVRIFF